MATLTILTSPVGQAGKQFVLRQRPLAGGRHPSQEIQLTDPEVSRKHFLIRPVGEGHVLTEVNSANGVAVNGQPVKEHALQEGDQITAGKTVLVYSQVDGAAQADAVQDVRRADKPMREGGTFIAR